MTSVRREVHGPRSDGARALDLYLRTKGISLPTFCDAHGLDRLIVQRAINGKTKRVSVELAIDIEKATDGAVPAGLWHRNTRRDDTLATGTDC